METPIPTHVAIIMDGNGRWAISRGLPRLAGHRAGTENLRRIITACVEFGIKYLTIYAFSTENWGRPREEVDGLMNILEDVIDRELAELHKEGVQLRHIGRLQGLDPKIQEKVLEAINLTRENDRLVLNGLGGDDVMDATGLAAGTTYAYRIYAHGTCRNYSTALATSCATIPSPNEAT